MTPPRQPAKQHSMRPYVATTWGMVNLFFFLAGICLIAWPLVGIFIWGVAGEAAHLVLIVGGMAVVLIGSVNFYVNRETKP